MNFSNITLTEWVYLGIGAALWTVVFVGLILFFRRDERFYRDDD